jgi:cytochrome c oxidase subunit 2
MTCLTPPAQKNWWKEPIERVELIWIGIVIFWGLILTIMMPMWHVYGEQNLSPETYRTTPQLYQSKAQAMVDEYKIREEGERKFPVVAPPVGSDVYLVARLWDWWPILELREGQSYRLHLTSMDWNHGFSLQPSNINIQVLPGYEHVITVTPKGIGEYSIVCNEFCGIGHHNMVGKIHVVK